MRDVLSGVAKSMGCFVSGCFVLHSAAVHLLPKYLYRGFQYRNMLILKRHKIHSYSSFIRSFIKGSFYNSSRENKSILFTTSLVSIIIFKSVLRK